MKVNVFDSISSDTIAEAPSAGRKGRRKRK
jgi:hypothetical protein